MASALRPMSATDTLVQTLHDVVVKAQMILNALITSFFMVVLYLIVV
jgi:hypothetical protein